ncbi:FAD-dependent monooxygenase [Marinicella sp. W31]|uniref:FAD-dependent monooxygenase n=1 Tax=Marinicella sp. W31 TaxID=3023713 RepID=UPI0037572F3C
MSSRSEKFDIVIAGGGLVGLIAAVSLARQNLRVVLLDAGKAPTYDAQAERELRVSAISAENLQWLESLQILPHVDRERIGIYRHMQVWDNASSAAIDFSAPALPHGYLGAIIENRHLQQAAWQQIQAESVTLRYAQKITEFNDLGSRIEVITESGDTYRTQLLVAADGANSSIRQQLSVPVQHSSYGQYGIVGYIQCDKAPAETALQGFNCSGPIGLLPLGNGLFSYVWSMTEDRAEDWLNCDETRFLNALKTVINRDLGQIELASQRAMFPLRGLLSQKFYQGRTVLCGDAAHVVHPMAGQGANLGIGDVKLLSEGLRQSILKDDAQIQLMLRRYQRRRYNQVRETSGLISGLHGLFGSSTPAVQWLRSTGMRTINRITPLKQWLMHQAGS